MQVAYRTVTNWEKKDGVIPSLSTISSIAKALHVPTYTVYDCFMNNPDSDPEENFFEFNKHDLTDGYRKSSLPGLLFKVMNTLHLFGGGILQYEGHVFYYSHISYKERKNTATNLDEELDYFMLTKLDKNRLELPEDTQEQVNINLKYEGYIRRQKQQVAQFKKLEKRKLDVNFDYSEVKGLRKEAIQKLNLFKPMSIGQASRISGVSPADISVLLVYLEQIRYHHDHE